MKQLKKTLLTLVALLALTTGAWATEFTSLKVGDVLHVGDAINTGTNYKVYGAYLDAGFQPATLIRANIGTNDITESETGAYYLIKGQNDYYYGIIWGDEDYEGGYWPVTDTSDGISVTAITPDGSYRDLTFAVHEGTPTASFATPVDDFAWDGAKKTGTFTMPGGNVTLEPEYYPQATLTAAPTAINDVPATTDGAIVKAGSVKNIGETSTAQGTVMYYVSPSALDDAALLALAADKWTADVPTAKSLAEGQAYVYYYVRGNDGDTDDETFSDGDILAANALTVTIAAEPTYAVTFAEGVNPEPPAEPEWTASPNAGVTKGETVTVTYTGSKKVIGVKAEKKATEPADKGHALSASAVGEIVGSDGKAYAVEDKDDLPSGVTAVAMVAYKSGSNGLAIQLNGNPVSKNWNEAQAYTSYPTLPAGTGSWRLPSKKDWQDMFVGCAVSGDASASDNMDPIAGFKAKIAATGITWKSGSYWSSTKSDSKAWFVYVELSYANASFTAYDASNSFNVLGCLAF